ncbi:MAG: ATP-dependent DNA helicase RecG, partial [Candidatus Gribaldobacteria bacterium]|nr:ATP-dependent DNA helicase RecG [Candidatus Gribaldobacteria bacterium]
FRQIHFPETLALAEQDKQRFAFEELFLVELSVLQARLKLAQQKAPAIALNAELMRNFTDSLSFTLTDAQRKCAWQILKDMEKPCPMSRLLEGDVGSGKTVVAIMAALNSVKAGFQVALMAPTEILAKQHFYQAAVLLRPFKIRIALLTGKEDQIISQKLGWQTKDGFRPETIEISRSKILERTKKGEIDLLIGTHTLIQDKVKFGKLGLVIVDEQHRFGIAQRAKLCGTSKTGHLLLPHLLSMTATPIPRTLALTIFGDLDLSLIDEMPKGRKEIITKVIAPSERKQAYDFIRQQVKGDNRVFVICPRIEKSETATNWSEAKAVKVEYEKLSKEVFPNLKVGMLHGKMKPKEKEKIMRDFKSGKIEVLVATTVIEVGVDIPKATLMLVEGADRFGLAQLHQLRGRVGRADRQSYCFLFTESASSQTRQRISAIIKAKNGFELAEKDLAIRGPGSLIGKKQWGLPDLVMANLTDLALVEKTRETAKQILQQSPSLKNYPILAFKVKIFEKQLHLE